MMRKLILAIDPGSTKSAYALLSFDKGFELIEFGKLDNNRMLLEISDIGMRSLFKSNEAFMLIPVVEMVASYGMAVGKDVFETCVWIGRFIQKFQGSEHYSNYDIIYRKEEKMCLCGTMKAKDSNIRQALIDRYAKHDFKNGKGKKNNPDVFYGVSADVWAAIAVGVTYHEKTLIEE